MSACTLALRLALLAAVLLLAGCGVPQDDEPRALDQAEAPAAAQPSPSALPEPVGNERVVLYFVREGMVVPVSRPVAMPLSATQLLELLLAGPTPAEQQAGASSLIPTTLSVVGVQQQGQVAVVTLRGNDDDDQVRPQALAFAQIVATLTPERAAGVRFRLAGADLPVPRSDGLLTNAPVQRSDYADLLVGGAGPAPSPPVPGAPVPTSAGAPPPTGPQPPA